MQVQWSLLKKQDSFLWVVPLSSGHNSEEIMAKKELSLEKRIDAILRAYAWDIYRKEEYMKNVKRKILELFEEEKNNG